MESRGLIKYHDEEGHRSAQIHSNLVELYGDKALSDPDVSYWVRELHIGRETDEDSRCSVRPPGLQTHFRIERALETSPNASVREIGEIPGIAPSMVFYILTQVC
jgi:hypothetical protein